MANGRANVFIASSMEALDVARALQLHLTEFETGVWTDLFQQGDTVIDVLGRASIVSDFAVIVWTADDFTLSRDETTPSPRDNVVFELGWFMSALGRRRTYFVCEEGVDIKLPTDLAGVLYTTFRRGQNMRAAVATAGTELRETMLSVDRSSDPSLVRERSLQTAAEDLVSQLHREAFVPDLVVGVSRGGLSAASVVAQLLGDHPVRPVLSIVPADDFRNSFNSFDSVPDFFGTASDSLVKVLVLDDVSKSGGTLERAKDVLVETLTPDRFQVRTAAMTQYEGEYFDRHEPDFIVNRANRPIVVLGHSEPFGS